MTSFLLIREITSDIFPVQELAMDWEMAHMVMTLRTAGIRLQAVKFKAATKLTATTYRTWCFSQWHGQKVGHLLNSKGNLEIFIVKSSIWEWEIQTPYRPRFPFQSSSQKKKRANQKDGDPFL